MEINKHLVSRHLQELMATEIKPVEEQEATDNSMLFADINQLDIKTPEESAEKQKKFFSHMRENFRKADQKRQSHEERLDVSRVQVEIINTEAKKLAGEVDNFIKKMRDAAREAHDNPRLASRLEQLRRMSVNYIRALQSQLPGYATAMFVQAEEPQDAAH